LPAIVPGNECAASSVAGKSVRDRNAIDPHETLLLAYAIANYGADVLEQRNRLWQILTLIGQSRDRRWEFHEDEVAAVHFGRRLDHVPSQRSTPTWVIDNLG
jgi:hypothetical protein